MNHAPARALIIEDKPQVQHELMEALLALGFAEATPVDDVAPALRLIADNSWDVIVLDLTLRTSYGLFVLDAIAQRGFAHKVVVYSVSTQDEVRRTCAALGCDTVFHRPTEWHALLDWCRQVLERRAA